MLYVQTFIQTSKFEIHFVTRRTDEVIIDLLWMINCANIKLVHAKLKKSGL